MQVRCNKENHELVGTDRLGLNVPSVERLNYFNFCVH